MLACWVVNSFAVILAGWWHGGYIVHQQYAAIRTGTVLVSISPSLEELKYLMQKPYDAHCFGPVSVPGVRRRNHKICRPFLP